MLERAGIPSELKDSDIKGPTQVRFDLYYLYVLNFIEWSKIQLHSCFGIYQHFYRAIVMV